MLRQAVHHLSVETRGRGLHEITAQVQAVIARSGLDTGLATLHIQHTSASLLIQENADPDVRRDLDMFFSRLVVDGDGAFTHTAEGADDMPAHVRSALTATQLSLPIVGGSAGLGTWQGIYVWEHRARPHRRRLILHLLGE